MLIKTFGSAVYGVEAIRITITAFDRELHGVYFHRVRFTIPHLLITHLHQPPNKSNHLPYKLNPRNYNNPPLLKYKRKHGFVAFSMLNRLMITAFGSDVLSECKWAWDQVTPRPHQPLPPPLLHHHLIQSLSLPIQQDHFVQGSDHSPIYQRVT